MVTQTDRKMARERQEREGRAQDETMHLAVRILYPYLGNVPARERSNLVVKLFSMLYHETPAVVVEAMKAVEE